MEVKELWSDAEFDEMGWHDCRIYSLRFPDNELRLKLDIDYIFSWEKLPNDSFRFWVSPCELIFENVSDFKAEVDFKNYMQLFIMELKRGNARPSPNGKATLWDYEIDCDNGRIAFTATGFEQRVRAQPRPIGPEQDLGR
jgi:hypothetical protein